MSRQNKIKHTESLERTPVKQLYQKNIINPQYSESDLSKRNKLFPQTNYHFDCNLTQTQPNFFSKTNLTQKTEKINETNPNQFNSWQSEKINQCYQLPICKPLLYSFDSLKLDFSKVSIDLDLLNRERIRQIKINQNRSNKKKRRIPILV